MCTSPRRSPLAGRRRAGSRPIGDGGGCCGGHRGSFASSGPAVAAVRRACVRHRLASSTLNPFSLCGFASRRAASAALRKVASFTGWPTSARLGLRGTPRFCADAASARRAAAIFPPVTRRITARPTRGRTRRTRDRAVLDRCAWRLSRGGGSVDVRDQSPGRVLLALRRVPGSTWKSAKGIAACPWRLARAPSRRGPRARRTCPTGSWRCSGSLCRGCA